MVEHNIPELLAGIEELIKQFKLLSDDKDLQRLIAYIRKPPTPPYTSVAEFTLVRGLVDGLIEQTKTLEALKHTLVEGGLAVSAK